VEKFRKKFEDIVAATITEEQLAPVIMIDTEIDFADISPKLVRILKQFQPFGPKNMSPVFLTRNVIDIGAAKTVGKYGEHLKLDLKQTSQPDIIFPAIAFQLGEYYNSIRSGKPFDVCYAIEENTFRGETKVQLQVKGIRTE